MHGTNVLECGRLAVLGAAVAFYVCTVTGGGA